MLIKYKLLIFFLGQHLAFILMVFLFSEFVIRPHNLQLEHKYANEKVLQIQNAFSTELEHLNLFTLDWASWTDTYDFLQDKNAGYIKANLIEDILDNTQLNRIEFFDINGKSFYSRSDGKLNIDSLFTSSEKLKDKFYIYGKTFSGVLRLKDKFAFVSVNPILKSDGSGPSIGSVMMIRHIDENILYKLNKTTNTNIQLLPSDSKYHLDAAELITEVISENELKVISRLQTAEGEDYILSEMKLSRSFVRESERLIDSFFVFSSILGLLSLIVSFYLIRKEIVRPLNALVKHIVNVREDNTYIHSELDSKTDEIGIVAKEFNHLLLTVKETNDRLKEIALSDTLTGLGNRMDLETHLERERRFSCREKQEFSILMLDIDYFKNYNDTYGHVKGDEVLIRVADKIKNFGLRPHDYVARYGGEEFIILLPETSTEGASIVAKRILSSIEELGIEHSSSGLDKKIISASIGCVSLIAKKDDTHEFLINKADKALYMAKNSGRDRCYVYQ